MPTLTHTESILHLAAAAAISAGLLGVGLRGGRSDRGRRVAWTLAGLLGGAMTSVVAYLESESLHRLADERIVTLAIVVLLGALAGVAMLALGLRGRRVGDHEYCRRCGFDLFGRPAGSRVCNECGAPLDARRAIVVGERRRRPVPLVGGAFLLFVAAAIGVGARGEIVRRASAYDWAKWKTEGWLVDDVFRTPGSLDGAALRRLTDRLERRALSRRAAERLVDRLLAFGPRPWGPMVYIPADGAALDVATGAWAQGRVDEGRVRAALRANMNVGLSVAPTAARGHTLRARPVALIWDRPSSLTYVSRGRTDTLDGRPLAVAIGSPPDPADPQSVAAFGTDAFALDAATPLGPAKVQTRLTFVATLAVAGRPTIVEERDVVLGGMTRVVEPGERHCEPVTMRLLGRVLPAPTPMPSVRLGLTATARALIVSGVRDGALVGDLSLRLASGETRHLRTICLPYEYDDVTIPLPADAPEPFDVEFRPALARGVEMFRPPQAYALPCVVPWSRMGRLTPGEPPPECCGHRDVDGHRLPAGERGKRMISQAESFVHIGVAAAISAAMVGVGLGVVGPAAYRACGRGGRG